MGALHIGTDGGGSIRIPAGFTGIFGLKQSFGRVPAHAALALRHARPYRPDDPHGGRCRAHAERADAARCARLVRPAPRRPRLSRRPRGRRQGPAHRLRADAGASRRSIRRWQQRSPRQRRLFADLGANGGGSPSPPSPTATRPSPATGSRAPPMRCAPSRPSSAGSMDPGLVEIAAAGARLPLLDYLAAVKEREAHGRDDEPASTATGTCCSRRRCRSPPSPPAAKCRMATAGSAG